MILDQYSALDHHPAMGKALNAFQAPWIREEDRRRLTAYMILDSYSRNRAGALATEYGNDFSNLREYGDAGLIVSQLVSSVLGDSQDVECEDEGALEFLREWMERENFLLSMMSAERDCVALGDAVWVLRWDGSRPRVSRIDPGFYFPVLDDSLHGDPFPRKVHLAWEFEEDGRRKLRRITYEMVPTGAVKYPWNEGVSHEECVMSDLVWDLTDMTRVDALSDSRAIPRVDNSGREIVRYPLGIDFIPVVHMPNAATGEHFGESSLSRVVQVLDDLAAADTDATAASGTTGTPMLVMKGAGGSAFGRNEYRVEPGFVFTVGEQGDVRAIDTSAQLQEMRERVRDLQRRVARSARVPEVALGGWGSDLALSGVALQIQYGPLSNAVRELRLARRSKYALLFKFVQRMAMLGGRKELPVFATLAFGEFMPKDVSGIVDWVSRAVEGGVLSVGSAVDVLRSSGVSVAADEAALLRSVDFDGAVRLGDATGDLGRVLEYLDGEAL